MLLTVILLLFGCGNQNREEQNVSEQKSAHQEHAEDYSDKSGNKKSGDIYKIAINNIKSLTEASLGSFDHPQFTINGKYLVFTTNNFSQLWLYSFVDETVEKIVELPQCGVSFQIAYNSDDIYFRDRAIKGKKRGGVFSILKYSISEKKIDVVYNSENRISRPIYNNGHLYFLENEVPKSINIITNKVAPKFSETFFYVENNNLIKMGIDKDTISYSNKNFKFISCEYSKDGECIFALSANEGVVALDLNGKPINVLSKAITVSKLYKSNLLVYAEEVDDGQKILSSNLHIGFMDSSKSIKLDNENNEIRINPDWSPTDNKIAYATDNGIIKIISFNIENTPNED